MSDRHLDAQRLTNQHAKIGDDLTPERLDLLWDYLTCESPEGADEMAAWFADKPHQIAYRLLLRLTRAEAERDRLRDILATTIRTLRDPRLPISEGIADGIIAGIEEAMAASGAKS